MEKVTGCTNWEFSTDCSADTQPYVTPPSKGSKKLKSKIPMKVLFTALVLSVVILLPAGILSKVMSTIASVSTNVVSTVATAKHTKLTCVPT